MATQKFDKNQFITDKILSQLDGEVIPWTKPWVVSPNGIISYATGKPYTSLVNRMMLDFAGEYATFNAIKKAGGKVISGKGSGKPVVGGGSYAVKDEETGEVTGHRFGRSVNYVFRIGTDTEGIEPKYRDKWEHGGIPSGDDEVFSIVKSYCERTGVTLIGGGNTAFYSPKQDSIQVPGWENFSNLPQFWSTVFHEIAHSTGHPKRLDELHKDKFGDSSYAQEELRAEITACLCIGRLGLDTTKCITETVAYCQSWRNRIKNFKAAEFSEVCNKAQIACDYIFNTNTNTQNKE